MAGPDLACLQALAQMPLHQVNEPYEFGDSDSESEESEIHIPDEVHMTEKYSSEMLKAVILEMDELIQYWESYPLSQMKK